MSGEAMKPQHGTWTLTAPDGRTWTGETPLRCVVQEQNERIPASVQLANIQAALKPLQEPVEYDYSLNKRLRAATDNPSIVVRDLARDALNRIEAEYRERERMQSRLNELEQTVSDKQNEIDRHAAPSAPASTWCPIGDAWNRMELGKEYELRGVFNHIWKITHVKVPTQ